MIRVALKKGTVCSCRQLTSKSLRVELRLYYSCLIDLAKLIKLDESLQLTIADELGDEGMLSHPWSPFHYMNRPILCS